MKHAVDGDPFELTIGRHPGRSDWQVLRLAYPTDQESRARVRRALDTLFDDSQTSPTARHGNARAAEVGNAA